jgi:hypothetical protein
MHHSVHIPKTAIGVILFLEWILWIVSLLDTYLLTNYILSPSVVVTQLLVN